MSSREIREARDSAWSRCREEREPYEGSDDWSVGEVFTYRGFFNLGYEAALSTIDPDAIRAEARAEGIMLASDRAREYLDGLPYYEGCYTNGLHAAILGTEPAQDDGKPEETDLEYLGRIADGECTCGMTGEHCATCMAGNALNNLETDIVSAAAEVKRRIEEARK